MKLGYKLIFAILIVCCSKLFAQQNAKLNQKFHTDSENLFSCVSPVVAIQKLIKNYYGHWQQQQYEISDKNTLLQIEYTSSGEYLIIGSTLQLMVYSLRNKRLQIKSDTNCPFSVSSCGQYIAHIVEIAADLPMYNFIVIWDYINNKKIIIHRPNTIFYSVCFSPDNKCLLSSADGDSKINIWDCKTSKLIKQHDIKLAARDKNYAVQFIPESGNFATSSENSNLIKIWSYPELKLVRNIKHPDINLRFFICSPNGKLLAAYHDNLVIIFNLENLDDQGQILKENNQINCIRFTQDNQYLACASLDKTVKIWDIKTSNCVFFEQFEGIIKAIAFSPDNSQMALAMSDKILFFKNIDLLKNLEKLSEIPFSYDLDKSSAAKNDCVIS